MSRVAAAIAAAVVSLGTLTACAGGPGSPLTGGVADDSWTVMTYMIADTNLEYFQLEDMKEQEAVGSRPGFNLISYLDRSDSYSDEAVLGLPDFTGAKVIKVKRGGSEVIRDVGETNTGDPDVLAEFIAETIQDYPAAHYALILNDHGSSWPGVGADGSADNDQLTLPELQEGIGAGLEQAGVAKLDLIGFDACLMATYETASMLQDLGDRMLSSAELEPGYGWDYTTLETAARGGTVDQVAAAIIKGFAEQSLAEGESQVTLSSIDLTKMAAVDDAVDAFAAQLGADAAGLGPVIGRALNKNLAFGATPDYNFYMTDLGLLAGALGGTGDALAAAIDDAVVDSMDGQATRGASGMAIYFPPTQGVFKDAYRQVPSAQNWIAFLESYYAAGQASGGVPKFVDTPVEHGFQNGGFVVAQQLATDPNQVTDQYVVYGYLENGGPVLIGDESAYIDDQNYVVGFFDTYQLWIGDGSTETSFYSTYSSNQASDVATIGVPILYTAGSAANTQGFLQMTYAPSTGTILSETFYAQDASGAFSEVSPESGAAFEALKVHAEGGKLTYFRSDPGTQIAADTTKLQFDYRKLPSGTTIYAEVRAVNSAGKGDAASATGVIP
ncbi:MAG TPA: clostripain-related cysteine peptidase [Pseudolysinimonas sp.]|nr:clostripain-related cysteine peptidase [Pseudolysinimonas sp.]